MGLEPRFPSLDPPCLERNQWRSAQLFSFSFSSHNFVVGHDGIIYSSINTRHLVVDYSIHHTCPVSLLPYTHTKLSCVHGYTHLKSLLYYSIIPGMYHTSTSMRLPSTLAWDACPDSAAATRVPGMTLVYKLRLYCCRCRPYIKQPQYL